MLSLPNCQPRWTAMQPTKASLWLRPFAASPRVFYSNRDMKGLGSAEGP